MGGLMISDVSGVVGVGGAKVLNAFYNFTVRSY